MKIHTLSAAGAAALSLSLAAGPALAAGNLVVNGSFETDDFTGWTQFGNTGATSFTGVATVFADGTVPVHGDHQAFFGPLGSNGGIRQDINTTAGLAYHISFFLRQQAGNGIANFAADFGGQLITLGGAGPHANKPYGLHEFSVLGTGSPMTLEFSFRNDERFFMLDDVVVSEGRADAIPEPATWALLIIGFMGTGAMLRRARRGALATL